MLIAASNHRPNSGWLNPGGDLGSCMTKPRAPQDMAALLCGLLDLPSSLGWLRPAAARRVTSTHNRVWWSPAPALAGKVHIHQRIPGTDSVPRGAAGTSCPRGPLRLQRPREALKVRGTCKAIDQLQVLRRTQPPQSLFLISERKQPANQVKTILCATGFYLARCLEDTVSPQTWSYVEEAALGRDSVFRVNTVTLPYISGIEAS